MPAGLVVGAVFLWLAPRSPWLSGGSLAAGGLVALAGVMVRAWAAGHIAKDRRLATGGPYAHTRHPLYLGSFLLAAGFGGAAHPGLPVVLAALWALWYGPVMRREALHVRTLFPHEYDAWAAAVPAFVPRLTPWRAPDARPTRFDPRLWRRHREWRAALGWLVAVGWLAVGVARRGAGP